MLMEMSHNKPFSRRKFVSVGLFATLVVLIITAIVIQIFEALEIDFFIHLFTVIHIFTGLTFTVLSVLHTMLNWQLLRGYFQTKRLGVRRETIGALLLTLITILTAVLFVCLVMD